MSKPTLYAMNESPPCRTVYLICKILGIDIDIKPVNLMAKEQLQPEFIAMNPFHTVPTFVDSDGFTMWESRAIAQYLLQKHRPDSSLYPANDLKRRARIDQCLQMDLGLIYRANADVVYGIFREGKPDETKIPRLIEVLELVEKYFEHHNSEWIAGAGEISLADITTYHTFNTMEVIKDLLDLDKYPKLSSWYKRVKSFVQQHDSDGILAKAQENLLAFAAGRRQEAASK